MTPSTPLPIVHINGFPGTGKLTIAKQIQKVLGDRCRLVHNHLLINPADAVLHRTEPGYQALRKAIRSVIFSAMAENVATHGYVYLFTDFQSDDATGSATCAEFLEAARARGCDLVPVILTCDEETNARRLQSPERTAQHKIVDTELLKLFRQRTTIHRFEALKTTSLELDVTEMSVDESAREILDHITTVCPALSKVLLEKEI